MATRDFCSNCQHARGSWMQVHYGGCISSLAFCRRKTQLVVSATSPCSRLHRHPHALRAACPQQVRPAPRWHGAAAAAVRWERRPMQPAPRAAAAAAGRGCVGARGASSAGRRRSGWGAVGGGSRAGRASGWTWHLRLPTADGSGGCGTRQSVPAPSPRRRVPLMGAAVMRPAGAARPGAAAAVVGAASTAAATITWPTCSGAS